jgi:hypothetical protein
VEFNPQFHFPLPTPTTGMANRYALTLGEQSEIHVGYAVYGSGLAQSGCTVDELKEIGKKFGVAENLTSLSDLLPQVFLNSFNRQK